MTVGDYYNDGYLDIHVTGYGGNQLFRNSGGGTFNEVTAKAGVGAGARSSSAAWVGKVQGCFRGTGVTPKRAILPKSLWRTRSIHDGGTAGVHQRTKRNHRFPLPQVGQGLDYRLIKELWAFTGNRIAVRFAYEWQTIRSLVSLLRQ